MHTVVRASIAVVGALLVLVLYAATARATADRTWVASGGTNNVTCDRTTPCQTFQQAHDVTNPGGEITCVDAADYGQVVINKSIRIVCDNTKAAILATTSGVTVGAGANDVVTLQGLSINGNGTGLQGINFTAGAALHVHKVEIRNFRSGNPFTAGILFQRTGSAYSELYVADSYITDNGGAGASSGGIVVFMQDTSSGNLVIDGVQLENSAVGVLVDISAGTGTTGTAINATVQNSVVVGGASHGIATATAAGKAPIAIVVDGVTIASNFGTGVRASGVAASGKGSAIIRVGNSTIVNNVVGVGTAGAGVVQSFKDNQIAGNLTDGTPLTAFPGPGGTPLQ